MREIKFRAYSKIYKKIQYDEFPTFINGDGVQSGTSADLNEIIEDMQDEYILMQYTGIKDKNGKKIYEGDIYRQNADFMDEDDLSKTQLFVVSYEKISDCCVNGMGFNFGEHGCAIDFDDLEVVGNIHENPELLNTPTESV